MLYAFDVLILLIAPIVAFVIGIVVVFSWQYMPRNALYIPQHYLIKISNIF